MEMASAATASHQPTPFSSPQTTNSQHSQTPTLPYNNNSVLRNFENLVSVNSAFEIKTRKDQVNSTASPVKVSRPLSISSNAGMSSGHYKTATSAASGDRTLNQSNNFRKSEPFRIFGFPRRQESEIFELSQDGKGVFQYNASSIHGKSKSSHSLLQVSEAVAPSPVTQAITSSIVESPIITLPSYLSPVPEDSSSLLSPGFEQSNTQNVLLDKSNQVKSPTIVIHPPNSVRPVHATDQSKKDSKSSTSSNEAKNSKLKLKDNSSSNSKPKHCQKCLSKSAKSTANQAISNYTFSSTAVAISDSKNPVKEVTATRDVCSPIKPCCGAELKRYKVKDVSGKPVSEKSKSSSCLDDPADFCFADCLKPCSDAILLYEANNNDRMTMSYPLPGMKLLRFDDHLNETSSDTEDKPGQRAPSSDYLSNKQKSNSQTSLNNHVKSKDMSEKDISFVLHPDASSQTAPSSHPGEINNLDNNKMAEKTTFTSPFCPRPGKDTSTPKTSPSSENNLVKAKNKTSSSTSSRSQQKVSKDSNAVQSGSSNSSVASSDSNNEKVVDKKPSSTAQNGVKSCPVVRHHDANLDNNSCQAKPYTKKTPLLDNQTETSSVFSIEDKKYFQHKYRLCFDEDENLETPEDSTALKLNDNSEVSAVLYHQEAIKSRPTTPRNKSGSHQSHSRKNGKSSSSSKHNGHRGNSNKDCAPCSKHSVEKLSVDVNMPNSSNPISYKNQSSQQSMNNNHVKYQQNPNKYYCNTKDQNKYNLNTGSNKIPSHQKPIAPTSNPETLVVSLPNGLHKFKQDENKGSFVTSQLPNTLKVNPTQMTDARVISSNGQTIKSTSPKPSSFSLPMNVQTPVPKGIDCIQLKTSEADVFSVLPYNDYVLSKYKLNQASFNSPLKNCPPYPNENLNVSFNNSDCLNASFSDNNAQWMSGGEVPTLSSNTKSSSGLRNMPIVISSVSEPPPPQNLIKRHSNMTNKHRVESPTPQPQGGAKVYPSSNLLQTTTRTPTPENQQRLNPNQVQGHSSKSHRDRHHQKQPGEISIPHGTMAWAELVKTRDDKKNRSGKCSLNDNSHRYSYQDGHVDEGKRKRDTRHSVMNLQAGPDLLSFNEGVNVNTVEAPRVVERSHNAATAKKTMSLLSRLAHSPLSLFTRDAKSSDTSK